MRSERTVLTKLKARIMWAAVRFKGPRCKPKDEKAKMLVKYGRRYLETAGKVFYLSKGNSIEVDIKIRIDESKLIDRVLRYGMV